MATLVTTTLARRSGGNTVFQPLGVEGGVGRLGEASTFQRLQPSMSISAKHSSGGRRTTQLRFAVPQVDTSDPNNPALVRVAYVDVIVSVPDGYPTTAVNDLIGFVEKGTATAVTNLNDLLVNGVGVF